MTRPSLLFLAHLLPYPPDSGAAIRTYNILKQLSEAFEVTALCFYRKATDPHEMDLGRRLKALSARVTVEAFPVPQETSSLRFGWDHLRSLLTARPYTYYVHDSGPFDLALQRVLAQGSFDLIHLDSLDLIRFLQRLPSSARTVCTHHNVESDLLRERADLGDTSAIMRGYLRLQSRLLLREERRWLPRMALNIAVSPDDALRLREVAPESRVEVIPNGVDIDFFAPQAEADTAGCVFVGGTNWFPNRDALDWFAEDIAPRVTQMMPSAHTVWVGHATEHEQARYQGERLSLTGYVDDVRPFVSRAACFVVPLRVGGGTRLKVLDAWAMGKAVVSTSQGCEGLATRPGENILIADDAKGFAEAVIAILKDDALRERLGAAGRQTAEAYYSWNALGFDLRRMYAEVLNPAPRL